MVYLYAILRVDRRFYIPDGVHGAGSYSAGQRTQKNPTISDHINSEEEVFDDQRPNEKRGDLEAGTQPATASNEHKDQEQNDTEPAPAVDTSV